jgi:two-component system, sensor histidine kinase and response regulator
MTTILVIDDETTVLKNVREILEFEDFQVIAAENGFAGLERIKEGLPDLVICDVMMPQLDGFGFLEAIRADPTTADLPVILITGIRDEGFLDRGRALGATDHLFKPFTIEQLLATVREVLSR